MRNTKRILLFAGIVLALIVIIYRFASQTKTPILSTQTNTEGEVTVEVTPKDLANNSASWDFALSLQTHAIDLDQDLAKSSILIDDNGNQFTPLAWEGDPPGGHHRQGLLRFAALQGQPASIVLSIKNIGDVPERLFKWEF